MFARDAACLGPRNLWLDRDANAFGDLILEAEDVRDTAVIALSKQVMTRCGLDQLDGDSNLLACTASAALDEIGSTKILADLRNVLWLVLVSESRIARDHGEPAPVGQRSNDVLGQSIDEIVFGRVLRHVVEGQHCYGANVGEITGVAASLRKAFAHLRQPKHVHRAGNVLQRVLAEIVESEVHFIANLVICGTRQVDAAGFGEALKTGRDIDALAEDITVLDHDVTDIDADPQVNALTIRTMDLDKPALKSPLHSRPPARRLETRAESRHPST